VSTFDATGLTARRSFLGRRGRPGDVILQAVAGAAAIGTVVLLGLIVWKVVEGARPAFSTFGLGFVTHIGWDPVHNKLGAATFLFGTAVTAIGALVLATPLALGIALFLTELAPKGIRGPVTALVETLAAIPSVVIGLLGIIVLGPILANHVMPALHSTLGFIPLFGEPSPAGTGIFTAIVVLTIMILPIISSISRELFLGVPSELKEAALGLGTTRWEMVRGVILPYTRGGVAAAMILGLGRAVGEAIAVAQVIGGVDNLIGWNLFNNGNTLAGKLALEYQGAATASETASLFYLAVILLIFSLAVNVVAQVIVRRTGQAQGLTAR
jgi:phosphate transport system permease protein